MKRVLLVMMGVLWSSTAFAAELDASTYANFCAAVSAAGSTNQIGLLVPNSEAVTAACTVTPNITLHFLRPGELNISSGVTVTINGPVHAPNARIFNGAGKVRFGSTLSGGVPAQTTNNTGNSSIDHVVPQWWGAVSVAYGDVPVSGNDSTAAFQAALDTSKSVFVPDGIYFVSSVTMKGDGQALYGSSLVANMLRTTLTTGSMIIPGNNNQVVRDLYIQNYSNSPTRQTVGFDTSINTKPLMLTNVFIGQFWRGIVCNGAGIWGDNVTAEGILNAVVYLNGTTVARLVNFNFATSTPEYGVYLSNGAQQNYFDQGFIDSTVINAVTIQNSHHNTFSNMRIGNSGQSGIYIDQASRNNSIQSSLILHNGVNGPSRFGIEVQNATSTRIVGNSIIDGSGGSQVQTYGVLLGNSSKGTILANNLLSPNLTGAYQDLGTLNRIVGNSENNALLADSTWTVTDDVSHMNGTFVHNKPINFTGSTFANLGSPANGSFGYCSNCTVAATCAAGGTGAFAKRLNGAWVCN